MITINIIGAGRLGKTIGKLIVNNKAGEIQAICNQSLSSSTRASMYIGAGEPVENINDLPPADLTLISTSDENINCVAKNLARSPALKKGSVALHCSGALTSAELSTLKEKNCLTCSVHPMHSFASPDISVSKFKGTYCAVEGDDEAVNLSIKIFSAIGGITYRIDSDKKTKYHASGVIASNYLVTLCHQAQKCLESTGVEPELAMKIITSLMQGTVDNLSSTLSSKNSLTGPIKRGDVGTVSRHLSAISDSSSLQEFYRQMGLLTLDIANNDPIINSRLVELLDSAKYDQNQTPKPSPAYP